VIAQIQMLVPNPYRGADKTEGLGDPIAESRNHPAGPLVGVDEPVPVGFGVEQLDCHDR
jgi:hypothetical protein